MVLSYLTEHASAALQWILRRTMTPNFQLRATLEVGSERNHIESRFTNENGQFFKLIF